MGANVSNQMITTTTSIVSNALNQVSTEMNSSASSYTVSIQEMPIKIKGLRMTGSSINLSQKADLKVTTMLESSSDLSNDLSNKLEAKLKETLNNELKQANEDLNLGQLNISNAQTNTNTYIEQNLSTIIKTAVNNSVEQTTDGRQYMPIDIENVVMKGSSINISQDMLMDVLAKNISSNIVKNVLKNALTADVQKEIKNKSEQLNSGINVMAIFSTLVVIVGGVALVTSGKAITASDNRAGQRTSQGGDRGELDDKYDDKDDCVSYGGNYGGLAKEEREDARYKKKVFVGVIVILILIYVAFVFAKKWVADKYDIDYLDGLTPETKSSFYVIPRMFYRRTNKL